MFQLNKKNNRSVKLMLLILFYLAIVTNNTFAQVETIHANNDKLQLSNLKEGTNNYLVYFTDSLHNRLTTGDLWERTTKLSTRNNQAVVEFVWKWYMRDTLRVTTINICDNKTLSPIYHKAVYQGNQVVAYDFRDGYMIPSDTIENNLGLRVGKKTLAIPIISWEQDLETFPLLPIKKIGQQFNISFFDPNEAEATYHLYEVVGKENLQLNRDTEILCWKLRINYDETAYGIFWLSEKSLEVLKMKEYVNGHYRYKIKLY